MQLLKSVVSASQCTKPPRSEIGWEGGYLEAILAGKKRILNISTLSTNIFYLREMFSIRIIIITLIISSLSGCKKDPYIFERVVEGTVFEDCNGKVSKGKMIYLNYYWMGCFGGGIISKDSTLTDDHGHFVIHYQEYEHEESTTSYWHSLTIPNSTINLGNPNGNYDLYPNENKMNAVIKLKFSKMYTSKDIFYYQFRPTYNGYVHAPELIGYFVGPFHDTIIVLNNLTVGNVNNNDNGKSYSGFFKWGIGIDNLNSYYTGRDGYFDLTHQPCASTDTFEYNVEPI